MKLSISLGEFVNKRRRYKAKRRRKAMRDYQDYMNSNKFFDTNWFDYDPRVSDEY